jgi:hypothetical protein
MYCTVSGGTDSADDSGNRCGARASSTPAEKRQIDRKAAASGLRVDWGISALDGQRIRMGSGTMGSSAPAGCGMGGASMESARKWMGFSRWILAVNLPFQSDRPVNEGTMAARPERTEQQNEPLPCRAIKCIRARPARLGNRSL